MASNLLERSPDFQPDSQTVLPSAQREFNETFLSIPGADETDVEVQSSTLLAQYPQPALVKIGQELVQVFSGIVRVNPHDK